jgi:hypothetical protein
MNRFLLGGCLIVLLGCGARTEAFTDQDGAGGRAQGAGGAAHAGGVPNTAGAPNAKGGSPGFAGAPNVGGGAPGVSGAQNASGAQGVSGAQNASGAQGVSGAPNVKGGAPGIAGSGGTPAIVEACQVIAGNSCQQCLCTTCSSQIVECFSNFGCALVLACAQQTGCQGVACYTAQTCRPVIDQFGGLTGTAMRDVLSLVTCSAGSQNSCSCN